MPSNDEIGRRIREAREQLGLSQGELGRRMTQSRSHAAISDIERGKTNVNVTELQEIAAILGKETSDFIKPRQSAAVNYLRHNDALSPAERKSTVESVEAFKKFVRGRAAEPKKDGK